MNEQKQLDWSQVIPGKTWLESTSGALCRVDAVMGRDVWVAYHDDDTEDSSYEHITWTKTAIDIAKWRIRGEWEDVTHECTLHWVAGLDETLASVWHQGYPITATVGYKLEGTRIYKRRPL